MVTQNIHFSVDILHVGRDRYPEKENSSESSNDLNRTAKFAVTKVQRSIQDELHTLHCLKARKLESFKFVNQFHKTLLTAMKLNGNF